MSEPQSNTLWRCTQCKYAVDEVLFVDEGVVHYRNYHYHDDGNSDSEFVKLLPLWNLNFEPLLLDDALAVSLTKSGGIF